VNVATVYGVDFSGASDAGDNVWVTELDASGDPAVSACQRAPAALAEHYEGEPTTARAETMSAIASFGSSLPPTAAVGFDFPFSVPAAVARGAFDAATWREVVDAVAACEDAVAFAERCVQWAQDRTDSTYLQRETDASVGALSPYHFFVNAQTYHGIADVLAPLHGDATVVPFDDRGERQLVAECYPAGTLDELGLHREGYKGRADAETRRREQNADEIGGDVGLEVPDGIRQTVVDDHEGDALDSLVAAVGVLRNLDEFEFGAAGVEGRIYA
jgi:hypothetical protein